MNIFCDDRSTNVKLAWYAGKKLQTSVSANSFRTGSKVEGLGNRQTFNYELDGKKYT
ncbi:plasmid segregation protein ParM domain-containing protein, partial [Enterobacter hormaechei]